MVTENDPKIHKRQAIYAPAFTACISPRDLTNIHQHQTIIFDHVITNYGSAYSTSTGIFTAPTPGIYIFFLEIMVTSHYEMYFEIVQDGTRIDDMYADSSTGDGFNSDSALWVLHLNRGSEVLIRSSTSYIEGHVGQIHGYCHSSLSGFLLNELENSG
ncbi:complement C1q-like protein 4 isoform X2 [Mya arenaria]|nr:complement C1q-like protein 4 isoform X2 [Mya arenaria]